MDCQFNAIHSRHDHIRNQQSRTLPFSGLNRIYGASEAAVA